MQEIRSNGLIGEKGKKAEDDLNLTMGKVAQLEGKFTWLHTSHKDLMKKIQESLSASQPLVMSAIDYNSGVSEAVTMELKNEVDKIMREINNIKAQIKNVTNELKQKIGEKVDDRALNELEDQLTTDIDQTIKSFIRRFAEKQDTKRSIRHIERQIRLIQETMGTSGAHFPAHHEAYNKHKSPNYKTSYDYLARKSRNYFSLSFF